MSPGNLVVFADQDHFGVEDDLLDNPEAGEPAKSDSLGSRT